MGGWGIGGMWVWGWGSHVSTLLHRSGRKLVYESKLEHRKASYAVTGLVGDVWLRSRTTGKKRGYVVGCDLGVCWFSSWIVG